MYANPDIFWVPVAGVRWKWYSVPCLITEMKQMENTVKCLYISQRKVYYITRCVTASRYYTSLLFGRMVVVFLALWSEIWSSSFHLFGPPDLA